MERRSIAVAVLALTLLAVWSPLTVAAGDKEDEGSRSSKMMALPKTQRLTLTLTEKGQDYAFSMTVASRHFSMHLGDKNIALRGRLWQGPSGSELIDYTLEFTQWIDAEDGAGTRRGSTWNGSAHLQTGRTLEIADFLDGSFSIRLDEID